VSLIAIFGSVCVSADGSFMVRGLLGCVTLYELE
jgi:hypothetical protein